MILNFCYRLYLVSDTCICFVYLSLFQFYCSCSSTFNKSSFNNKSKSKKEKISLYWLWSNHTRSTNERNTIRGNISAKVIKVWKEFDIKSWTLIDKKFCFMWLVVDSCKLVGRLRQFFAERPIWSIASLSQACKWTTCYLSWAESLLVYFSSLVTLKSFLLLFVVRAWSLWSSCFFYDWRSWNSKWCISSNQNVSQLCFRKNTNINCITSCCLSI